VQLCRINRSGPVFFETVYLRCHHKIFMGARHGQNVENGCIPVHHGMWDCKCDLTCLMWVFHVILSVYPF